MIAAIVLACAVSVAGGVGAVLRYTVDTVIAARIGRSFPVGTLAVNLTGSALIGVLTGLVLADASPPDLQVVLGTGFCGGYTTFGTASLDTVRLVQSGRRGAAAVNLLTSVGGSVAACAAGVAVIGVAW